MRWKGEGMYTSINYVKKFKNVGRADWTTKLYRIATTKILKLPQHPYLQGCGCWQPGVSEGQCPVENIPHAEGVAEEEMAQGDSSVLEHTGWLTSHNKRQHHYHLYRNKQTLLLSRLKITTAGSTRRHRVLFRSLYVDVSAVFIVEDQHLNCQAAERDVSKARMFAEID